MDQVSIKYANIFKTQDPPKFTQIWIFGSKTNHLTTLVSTATRNNGFDGENGMLLTVETRIRVTRLGEICPLGDCLLWAVFLHNYRNSPHLWATFFPVKVMH
jgi:hypothetical protein